MYAFEYHRPSTRRRGRRAAAGRDRRQAPGRRPDPDPDAEAAPRAAVRPGRPRRHRRAQGDPGRRRQASRSARMTHACRGRRARRTSQRRDPGARRSSPSSIGDPQVRNRGTHRRLDRQQRPGGRLPGRGRSALNATVHTNQREIAADDFFTGMFETALERRRDHHRGALPEAGQGGLREVPQPGEPLRARRRVRRADRRRRAGRGHRRGPVRVPAAASSRGARAQLLGRARSRA